VEALPASAGGLAWQAAESRHSTRRLVERMVFMEQVTDAEE
jgi:hypothetical protein